MLNKRQIRTGLAGFAVVGGALLAVPGAASATTHPRNFQANQTLLEQQLSSRSAQLTRLSADVSAASVSLGTNTVILNKNIASANVSIQALIVKVPTDTTNAEVNADRTTMLAQNRVFAVLTPQVFLTIEADAIAGQVVTFQANESALQGAVNALVGQHGFKNASVHFVAFVKAVNTANENAADVTTAVLAQVPADYPGDTHVFTSANSKLLKADLSLAHASYDETVIGLASGGYTGS